MEQGVYPYFREIEGKQGTEVEMGGHRVLMFGSNAYTGLTGDERVIEAGIKAMRKYGSGCAGSRFLNGTLDLHVQLERELAEFVGKDEALCFSTGFGVNAGVVACLTGREDYIICDDRDHASIVDGRRLSFSTCLKYKHNDMADLERQLQKCAPEAVKLIVVDGVFSMEGDLANLPEIVRLKHKYNATVMVDEAHGLGVFQHVADVTAADAQTLGGGHGVLRGDAGVSHRQQRVAGAGFARRGHAGGAVGARPAAAVGQKHQAEGRFLNKRLVVAQFGQRAAQRRVGDVQNRVQLLVAGRRRGKGSVQNGGALLRRYRRTGKHAYAFARVQRLQNFVVHRFTLPFWRGGAESGPAVFAKGCIPRGN